METLIAIPVSRKQFVDKLFKSLEALECDTAKTALFLYIDGHLDLYEYVRQYIPHTKFKINDISYRNRGIGSSGGVKRRRRRIADIHNELIKIIPDYYKYIFLIEDDTIVPPNALVKLQEGYKRYPDAGFISGIELGRWGYPINGAWIYQNNILESWIGEFDDKLIQVTSAGLYCCLIKRTNYIDNYFMPFNEILGPDVSLGLHLSCKGLKNYINPSIQCEHLQNDRSSLQYNTIKPIQLKFCKIDNEWKQEVIR